MYTIGGIKLSSTQRSGRSINLIGSTLCSLVEQHGVRAGSVSLFKTMEIGCRHTFICRCFGWFHFWPSRELHQFVVALLIMLQKCALTEAVQCDCFSLPGNRLGFMIYFFLWADVLQRILIDACKGIIHWKSALNGKEMCKFVYDCNGSFLAKMLMACPRMLKIPLIARGPSKAHS